LKSLRKTMAEGSTYGRFMILVGVLVLAPLAVIPFFPEEADYVSAFLMPGGISAVLGAAVMLLKKNPETRHMEWQSSLQRGSLPVMFAWLYGIFLGSLPFVISGLLPFRLAVFESTSGWTTTGMTVVDVDAMPHVILFHRSFMQYSGGLGFIAVMVMVVHGKQSAHMFSAEGHIDKLAPNLRASALTILRIYAILLAFGTILYFLFGMEFFDALCHAMSALSTAGFSTRSGSIGAYDSIPIDIVTIVLMLAGSTNFVILYFISKRRFKRAFKVSEIRFMGGLIAVFFPLITLSLIFQGGVGIGKAILDGLFGVISVVTTTAYSTSDFWAWPPFCFALLVLLMLVGGGIGSTAGGIKLVRVYLMLRAARLNIRRRLSPARDISLPQYERPQGRSQITAELIGETFGFVTVYFGIMVIGTLILTLSESVQVFDAMFEFTSAFATVGLTNGITRPDMSTVTLITQIVGMILGRLEIFIFFVAIYECFRKARRFIEDRQRAAN